MKYVAPFGQSGDAPYINGNPAAGVRGSKVPAEALEHPMREIMEVITHAGLTPSGTDLTQLRQAIISIYQALSGAGDTEDFLTMTLARARLPFFPEILTADGRVNVISPGAGTVQIPSGVLYVHRGIQQLSTSDLTEGQRTFATAGNKVYHLRWRPASSFGLFDLANADYNPSAAAETDPRFDTTFDDMLVARVVTNSSNAATITNLANLPLLRQRVEKTTVQYPLGGGAVPFTAFSVGWARTPRVLVSAFAVPPDMSVAQWEFPFGVEVGGPAGPGAPTRYDGGARVLGFVPAEGSFGLGTFRLELDA